jgi:hypothetical protein
MNSSRFQHLEQKSCFQIRVMMFWFSNNKHDIYFREIIRCTDLTNCFCGVGSFGTSLHKLIKLLAPCFAIDTQKLSLFFFPRDYVSDKAEYAEAKF